MDHAEQVIVIVLDSVRADALTEETAPNLSARVKSDWITYENAFATAPWTLPSHASIFTGRLPREHGATAHNKYLSFDGPTLADRFTESGFQTRLISNNPFLSDAFGMTDGFEEIVLHLDTKFRPDSTGIWVADILERSDSWSETIRTLFENGNRWTPVNLLYELLAMQTDLVGPVDNGAKRAVDYYRQNGVEGPEFTFFNFMEPHLPYHPPEPFRSEHTPPGTTPDDVKSVNQEPWDFMLGETDTDFELLRGLYEGEIGYLDTQLERLFQTLESDGRLNDSLIVLCGDHGDHFGEHGFQGHAGSLHRELLHVPLYVRYPDRDFGGDSVTHPVSLRQLFSSLPKWMGIDTPGSETSPSRLPLPGETPTDKGVVAEYMGVQDIDVKAEALHRYDYRRTSVLTDEGSLIESAEGVEFKTGDIGEEELLQLKENLLETVPDTVRTDNSNDIPPSVRDRLEATGYIQ